VSIVVLIEDKEWCSLRLIVLRHFVPLVSRRGQPSAHKPKFDGSQRIVD